MKFYSFIVLIAALLFTGCAGKSDEDPDLATFITAELQKDSTVLSFKNYKPGAWNKMYVVFPYAHEKLFDQNLLEYKEEIFNTGIEVDDNISVVVFFQNDTLVSITTIRYPLYIMIKRLEWKDHPYLYLKRSETRLLVSTSKGIHTISWPSPIRQLNN